MDRSDLCSIIIPTHARPDRVVQAVDSVRRQTDPHWEVWIVCDGPQPETEAALLPHLSDSRIRLLRQNAKGVSAARNHGIAQASGDWIAFLDDDDCWHPQKLLEQREWMRAHGYLVSQCEEIWIRNGKRVNPMRKHTKPSGWIFSTCIDLCAVSPSAVMLHRSVLSRLGDFDEQFPVCEDYDFWLRVSLYYPIGTLRKSLITKFGGHDDQLSRRYHSMDRWRIRALEKILQDPLLAQYPAWRDKALQSMIDRTRILREGARKRGLL